MKNQYFADEGDYYKYGLLRALAKHGFKTQVGWMLTSDTGTGGPFIGYLNNPLEWRHHDPELYDFLKECVEGPRRRHIDELDDRLVPGAVFTNDELPNDAAARELYFAKLAGIAADKHFVFLDPDTGIAPLTKRTIKTDPQHVQIEEIGYLYDLCLSVIIYQHLPPGTPSIKRCSLLQPKATAILQRTKAPWVASLKARRSALVVVPQEDRAKALERLLQDVERQWQGKISTCLYPRAQLAT